jgi:dihydropteroate synthase
MLKRAFVLAPLAAIAPQRIVPGAGGLTTLAAYRRLQTAIPLWMGIVNVTPDSFSDGGRHVAWDAVAESIESMTAAGAAAIDFGAESTRPGATALTADQEWSRLAPILERAIERMSSQRLRPAISVDTYHAEVARRAIELGADVINDVGGLTDPAMIELAAGGSADWIAMHRLTLPANPAKTLDTGQSAIQQVQTWLDAQLDSWTRSGIDTARVTFDPGVGFGKTPLQSLELLRGIDRFVRDDLRVLVGHSRKSFLRPLGNGNDDAAARDLLTIGASLELGRRGADILRVHNVPDHATAWRGFAHAQPPGWHTSDPEKDFCG